MGTKRAPGKTRTRLRGRHTVGSEPGGLAASPGGDNAQRRRTSHAAKPRRAHSTVIALAPGAAATFAVLPWLLQIPFIPALLCGAQVALTAMGCARAAYPSLRPVALVAFTFTFSWLGIAPAYQLAHHVAAWNDSLVLDSPDCTTALLLTVGATVAMHVGFFGFRGPQAQIPPLIKSAPALAPRLIPSALLACCLALSPSAVAANGGLMSMFSDRTARGLLLSQEGLSLAEAGGVKLALTGALPSALAVAAAYLLVLRVRAQWRAGSAGDIRIVDLCLLTLALSLCVLFCNPFTNPRGVTIIAFGPLLLLVLQPRSKVAGLVTSLALLTTTLVLYPLANVFRGAGNAYGLGMGAFAGPDFDGFQQVVNAVSYVRDNGHTWGSHTLSALLFPVPRSLWTGKAIPASIDVATHRGYEFTNLSLPVHAELYVEFGALGMLLAIAGLCRLGGAVDSSWLEKPGSLLAALAPYVAVMTLSVIRGPLGANVPYYLPGLLLIAAGLRRAQGRTLPKGSGGPPPRELSARAVPALALRSGGAS